MADRIGSQRKRRDTPDVLPRRLSTKKRLAYSAAIWLTVLMVSFVVLEVSLRLVYGRIERITGVSEFKPGTFGEVQYLWDEYHPRYGWTNRPAYSSDESIPFRVTINSQGLRGSRDYDRTPPSGKTRIVVFGDSCTFGEEVDDDETVPHFLEQHLADAEVLNFGVHGYGLGQMALRLEEEAFAFDPHHVVVILLIPHDIYRDFQDTYVYNKPVFSLGGGELMISNVPVPEASRQPWPLRYCFTTAYLFGRPKQFDLPADSNEFIRIAFALLRRIKDRCDEHQVPFTLVNMTDYRQLVAARGSEVELRYLNRLRDRLDIADLNACDVIDELERAYYQDPQAMTEQYGHWSPLGNELIARGIAEHLSQNSPGSWPTDGAVRLAPR